MIRLPPARVPFRLGYAEIEAHPGNEYRVKITAINPADFRLIATEAITILQKFDDEYFPHVVENKSVTLNQTAEREWLSQNTTGPWMLVYTTDNPMPHFRFQLPEEGFAFRLRFG
jgi:hypothetical protein